MLEALIFVDRFVAGWPKADDPRAIVAPIAEILTQDVSTDMHFAGYVADVARRHTIALYQDRANAELVAEANAELVAEANVRMVLAVFDVDGPEHLSTEEWQAAEGCKLPALYDAHPGGFVYETRGGYRLVWALPEPHPIRSQADDDKWTARYLSWCRYLARRFDIRADQACADWTRLFRIPRATRDGVLQTPDTFGDASALGAWAPMLASSDIVAPKKGAAAAYGVVQPVPIDDQSNEYGQRRLEAAVRYLETAPLSIKHQGGRTTMFKVCCILVRRKRLPLDLAADLIEAIYLPRLAAAGTAVWSRDTPGPHGMSVMERLEKARDTGNVPPGDVPTEAQWNMLARAA